MTSEEAQESFEFDVALSFAGEDREYVEEIADLLRAANVRLFYDADYLSEMWGEDLVEYFDDVYRVKARWAIIFVSQHYAKKTWTRHERRSALARALEQTSAYVLPVRLDDTELAGLRSTVGYLDARRVGIPGIVDATLKKLDKATRAESSGITRVPRTEAERQQALLDRPIGWEYLYFAGQLLHELNATEPKYLDHEIQYAMGSGEFIDRDDVTAYLSGAASEAGRLASLLTDVMSTAAQERAFGAPEQPGNPDRLLHLARRWNGLYEAFLDWAARLRGTTLPSEYRDAANLLARFMDGPIESYRQFISDLVTQLDEQYAAIVGGENVVIKMTLVLEVSDEAVEEFQVELERVLREDF